MAWQKTNPPITPPAKTSRPTTSLTPKSKVSTLGQHRNNPNIRFQQQGGLISLEARQATWPQLLETIEQHTGARFHYASLPVYQVSLSLKGRSAQEVLTHLFGSATGYACRFSKSGLNPNTGWPKEIWVMGIIASNTHNQTLLPLPTLQTSVKDLTDEQLEEAVQLHYQRELENLIYKVKNGTQDEKNQALVELSTRPEDETNKDEMNALLKEGLRNEDPDIRGQILYGLATGGHDDGRQFIQEGLTDGEAKVRATAVNAMSAGDEQDIKLLNKMLNDTDAAVRGVVLEKLKQFGVHTDGD